MKKKLTLSLILTFLMLYSLAVTISASEMHNTTTTTINMVRETAVGKVQLSWSKKAVDGYQVKWSRYSNMSSGKTASTTKTSWSRSGLAGGKTYYFTVRTYKLNNGKKDYSAWKTEEDAGYYSDYKPDSKLKIRFYGEMEEDLRCEGIPAPVFNGFFLYDKENSFDHILQPFQKQSCKRKILRFCENL